MEWNCRSAQSNLHVRLKDNSLLNENKEAQNEKPLRSLQIYMWVQLLFIFLFNTRKQLFIIFMIMILYIFVLLDTYLFSLQKLLFRPFSIFKFSVFGCKGSLYILNTSPLLSFLVRTFLVVLYKAQTEVILKLCQTTFPHKIIKN